MIKMEFTEDEINELYHEFMGHPAGTTKNKLHVVYLKSLNLSHQDIALIARVDTVLSQVLLKNQKALSSGVTILLK
ncbi:hypothetical protein BMR11_13845, partial [Methylococcaceae bacterium CS5]